MDTVAKHVSDDLDLDALMIRVREAAMAGATSGAAARPQTGGKGNGEEHDLVRLLDAQGEWNEHTKQSLAALVDGLRTLRDDWLETNARLREEIRELSALVAELRTGAAAAATKIDRRAGTSKRARATSGAAPMPAKRRASDGGRRRS